MHFNYTKTCLSLSPLECNVSMGNEARTRHVDTLVTAAQEHLVGLSVEPSKYEQQTLPSPLSSDFLFGSDIVCCCPKTDKRCINTVNEYSMEFKWGVKNFWVIRKWASRQPGRKWLDLKKELMLFLCVSRLELDVHAATQLLGNQAVDTYTRDLEAFTRQSYENCCDFIWISLHYLQIVWKVLSARIRVKWVKYSNSFSGQWIRWQLVSSRLVSCRRAGFVLFA